MRQAICPLSMLQSQLWPRQDTPRVSSNSSRNCEMPTETIESLESITLPVIGMTCASCQHHVEGALQATAGVHSAHVDLMGNRASVLFDPQVASPEALIQAIRGAGY